MTVLDAQMLGVALPGIARDLGISPASATWLLNAYQLAVVSTLLPLSSLAEIVGFRRVYLTGFAVFAAASVGAALAPGFGVLVAFRMLQGLGAAAVMSLTAGMIRHTFPQAQLGRAIGINAMVVAVSGASAPGIAAAVLAVAPWPFLFLVHVPLGLLGLAVGARALPDPPRARRSFDTPSAALNVLAFGLLFLGLDLLLAAPGLALPLMGLGALAAWFLVRRQLSRPAPLLPLDLLRIRAVGTAVAASVCGFAAWYSAYLALPFLFQATGRDQAEAALLLTPWPLALAVAAPLAGRLADRVPTALLCTGGMASLATGLALLAGPASAAASGSRPGADRRGGRALRRELRRLHDAQQPHHAFRRAEGPRRAAPAACRRRRACSAPRSAPPPSRSPSRWRARAPGRGWRSAPASASRWRRRR